MHKNQNAFRAILITRGRKTGKPHSVSLRAVVYEEKIFFSRHRPDSDWFQNALVNSTVEIKYDNKTISGEASQVLDENLAKKISYLKYPGEKRAEEKRVVLQVIPNEQ